MDDDKTYRSKVVRLCELGGDEGVIDGFTFIDCEIRGPAVVVLQGEGSVIHSRFGGDAEGLLWEITPPRERVIGAILVKDCHFEDCRFEAVGFAGPPELIRKLREGSGLS